MTEAAAIAMPALDVQGLSAFYGKSQVVFDADLEAREGEIVAVLGRNGAGKTTMLHAIAGLIEARSLRLRLGGSDVGDLPPFRRVRAGLSLAPSGSRAFPNLTVYENLSIVRHSAQNGDGWSVADVYDAFPALAQMKSASAGSLSGGERQMLAVGRAMLTGPTVLMMDEPSEGLAPVIVKQIAVLVRDLAERGLAVVLTEQNHRLALDVADRAYFIEKGQVVWHGTALQAQQPDVIGRYLAI
jgi:branched-chain amino acid transport system ATP-binding protein